MLQCIIQTWHCIEMYNMGLAVYCNIQYGPSIMLQCIIQTWHCTEMYSMSIAVYCNIYNMGPALCSNI